MGSPRNALIGAPRHCRGGTNPNPIPTSSQIKTSVGLSPSPPLPSCLLAFIALRLYTPSDGASFLSANPSCSHLARHRSTHPLPPTKAMGMHHPTSGKHFYDEVQPSPQSAQQYGVTQGGQNPAVPSRGAHQVRAAADSDAHSTDSRASDDELPTPTPPPPPLPDAATSSNVGDRSEPVVSLPPRPCVQEDSVVFAQP